MTKSVEKVVVNLNNFNGFTQSVLINGKSPYTGKTESDYIKEGFTVITWEEFDGINEKYLDSLCGKWKEITEEQFDDMLNVLPPMRWSNGGFYMSERYTADVTGYYQQIGDKYYTSNQRLSYKRNDILNSLNDFINSK